MGKWRVYCLVMGCHCLKGCERVCAWASADEYVLCFYVSVSMSNAPIGEQALSQNMRGGSNACMSVCICECVARLSWHASLQCEIVFFVWFSRLTVLLSLSLWLCLSLLLSVSLFCPSYVPADFVIPTLTFTFWPWCNPSLSLSYSLSLSIKI